MRSSFMATFRDTGFQDKAHAIVTELIDRDPSLASLWGAYRRAISAKAKSAKSAAAPRRKSRGGKAPERSES